jgi:hypothetical protein
MDSIHVCYCSFPKRTPLFLPMLISYRQHIHSRTW